MSNARRLLLDTNILLDYAVPDRPHSAAAATLVHMAGAESLTIFVTPGSLKDMYYIARKYIDEQTARQYIELFTSMSKPPGNISSCFFTYSLYYQSFRRLANWRLDRMSPILRTDSSGRWRKSIQSTSSSPVIAPHSIGPPFVR